MFSSMRFMLAIAFLVFFVSPSLADELFSFKAGYYTLNPEGDIAVSGSGIPGTKVDMDEDLSLDDSDDFFAEAILQFGDFRLYAGYLPINFSGESILTQDVDFNGETFVIGSHVETEVQIDIYEAGLAWFLINLDDMPVRIQFGPEVAVKYVDASLKMQDDSLIEAETLGVALPSVGARLRVAVADYLGVVGRAGYIEYNDNSFMDFDAQVELSPLPLVGVYAGYRYLDLDVDESDVFIDATFSGPYAGAMVRF